MENRKEFLRKAGIGAALLAAGGFPFGALAADPGPDALQLLHTNDLHGRLEAFPEDGGRYAGQGGAAVRASLIAAARAECPHTLLFDSGDVLQGSPWLERYRGVPEFAAMGRMGYDAVTIGNHDLDGGIDLYAQAVAAAGVPVVIANYGLEGTALEGKTVPYRVLKAGGRRVGVFGIGIGLEGLVAPELRAGIRCGDAIETARRVSAQLRRGEGCDLVVCLSHLGLEYSGRMVSDRVLARETEHVDVVLGGHTHRFMETPLRVANRNGKEVWISQSGWGGIAMGKLNIAITGRNTGKNQAIRLNAQTVFMRT